MGFRQIIPGGYLLAIWFNRIPERTVVWSANRDNLVQEGSILQLYADGRFELRDPRGQQIWSATSSRGAAYGSMLDTGNFVLANNSSVVLWRSFDEPTDTLLPTQILNKGGILVSSFSETNYSRGRFLFTLQNDGNLVSSTRNFPMDNKIFDYWSTKTSGSGFQVIFNQSGYIFLVAENGSVLNFVSRNGASTSQFYQRAILEYDGVLRNYVYPKSANSAGGREMAWSSLDFIPSNICTSMRERSGFGACGFNSLCSLGSDQLPQCDCPRGYTLIDPSDRMSGCKPNFVTQNCDEGARETDLFGFIDMPNTNWPFSDYALFEQITEDWCRRDCLNDCFCVVAIYNNGRCWKKQYPLTNGAIDSSLGGKALIKIRNNNATAYPSVYKKSKSSTLIIIVSVFLGSSMFLLLSLLLYVFCFTRQKSKSIQPYQDLPGLNIRRFSFKELQVATNGFKEELGRGAFSTVYKGILKNDNIETVIAVKKLHKMATEGEQEFKAEVNSISSTNHKNLVQLLGYCQEGQDRVLVYEFMSNGSLAKLLFENSRPNCFGILLLELICSRRNYEPDVEFETEMILADFAYDCYKEGTMHLLVADDEEALGDKRFDKFVMIAIWCIQEEPTLRPTMKRVMQLMEGFVEVPIPPDPTSSITSV
ncbi:unnamed protein product [Fraxinus pennsylvanica]|uniref:non-specific serine/threonine protein kinase n=1 Tax=Fraxinus pennsylvanica TaxID=56036 RepID=A0AAD1Z1V4_9LAMI|nr:unnamed protein product [Fraxinus pennsylvanica]